MARRSTFQYTKTMTINREQFINQVVKNEDLSKKDLRVLLALLTHLDSLIPKEIDKKKISETLNISKKDVKDSIESLKFHGLIREDNDENGVVTGNTYRLLF